MQFFGFPKCSEIVKLAVKHRLEIDEQSGYD